MLDAPPPPSPPIHSSAQKSSHRSPCPRQRAVRRGALGRGLLGCTGWGKLLCASVGGRSGGCRTCDAGCRTWLFLLLLVSVLQGWFLSPSCSELLRCAGFSSPLRPLLCPKWIGGAKAVFFFVLFFLLKSFVPLFGLWLVLLGRSPHTQLPAAHPSLLSPGHGDGAAGVRLSRTQSAQCWDGWRCAVLRSGAGCGAALAWLRMAAFAFILDFYCDRRACIRVLRVCSATGPGLWMSAPQAVALGSWSSFFLSYFSSWIQAALCSGFPSVSVLKFGKWRGERLTLLFSSILEAVFWHRDTKLSGAWPVLLFFALRPRNAGLLPAP